MTTRIQLPFGKALKQRRLDAGLTQEELANLIDVDQSTLSKWELRTKPLRDRYAMNALSEHLNVSVVDLRLGILEKGGDSGTEESTEPDNTGDEELFDEADDEAALRRFIQLEGGLSKKEEDEIVAKWGKLPESVRRRIIGGTARNISELADALEEVRLGRGGQAGEDDTDAKLVG